MNSADSKKFVLDFFADLSAGKVDKAWESLAEDSVWDLMAKASDYPYEHRYTKSSYRELMNESGTKLFPNGLKFMVKKETAIAEGGLVAFEAETYGTAFNGKIYNNFYHFRVEVKNGKIQAVREYLDSGYATEILGKRGQV